MIVEFDPDLDLRIDRLIAAPRERVWAAWANADRLARWWLPAPTHCRIERLDLTAGGAFVASASDDGVRFAPQFDGCFLVVDPTHRLSFTNAITSRWRPAHPAPVAITADVTLDDERDGTRYRVVVRHGDARTRARHEALGFHDGWGTVLAQLATLVESSG